MNKLNYNGIKKVLSYLNREEVLKEDTGSLSFSINEIAKMAKIGIITEWSGNGYDLYLMEQGEIEDPEQMGQPSQEERRIDPAQLKSMADQLVEPLSEHFTTKQQVNDALENLKASMIDPEEWEDMLMMWKKMINKNSKSTDAVG